MNHLYRSIRLLPLLGKNHNTTASVRVARHLVSDVVARARSQQVQVADLDIVGRRVAAGDDFDEVDLRVLGAEHRLTGNAA